MSKLDSSSAHTTTNCLDQQTLTHFQTCLGKKRIVGSDKDFGHTCCLHKIQVGRYFHEQTFVGHDVLRLCTSANQAHHALTRLPCSHQRSHRVNLARKFHSWNVLR